MRFNNEDYLRAFPRDERASADKQIISDQQKPGSVFENVENSGAASETPDPEPVGDDQEGGGADGNE